MDEWIVVLNMIENSKFVIIIMSDQMFDSLSNKLDSAFKLLKGHGKITEIDVAETLKGGEKGIIGCGR